MYRRLKYTSPLLPCTIWRLSGATLAREETKKANKLLIIILNWKIQLILVFLSLVSQWKYSKLMTLVSHFIFLRCQKYNNATKT